MAKILVVDDSSFARATMRRRLEEAGYTVIEADSGQRALELAAREKPDLATLDLLMPGMSGNETLAQLRPLYPALKILVVSADVQALTRQEVLAAGANGFLNKPVATVDLLATVSKLLAE